MFGRTPLIKLSPKKTVEGFVGGALFTVVAAVLLTNFLSQYEWMYCSRRMLEFNRLHCDKPDAFVPVEYHLTDLWEVCTAHCILMLLHLCCRALCCGCNYSVQRVKTV